MQLKEKFNIIKQLIIDTYNEMVDYIKKLFNKKPKINKQIPDQNIHVIKAKVKRVKIKNNEN